MSKLCESYDFKIEGECIESPFQLCMLIEPLGGDCWSGLRLVSQIGKRFSTELKAEFSIQISVVKAISVILIPHTFLTKEAMESAVHSLYLWLEHPEKH